MHLHALSTLQALIKKYVVKGLPKAVEPPTAVGKVLCPLCGRLVQRGLGCSGHRTVRSGSGAAGCGLALWARLGVEEFGLMLGLGELSTPLCERMAL